MEFIANSISRCQVTESAEADASSYDTGSLASVKQIPGEYLSGGYDSLSDLRSGIGLVTSGIEVGWSKAETFSCAESSSVESVLEVSATRDADLMSCVEPS